MLNEKQSKLLKDLEVVWENILLTNDLIDNRDEVVSRDMMIQLQKLEKKLMKLPDILSQKNENFLYQFTLGLLTDIDATEKRYKSMKQGKKVIPFNSRVYDMKIPQKTQ